MTKLLFIIDALNCGGAEKSLVSLLPLLDQKKYEVYLWPIVRGGVFEKLVPANVTIIASPRYDRFRSLCHRGALALYSISIRISRLLRKKKHLSELYWSCCGKTTQIPKGDFDIVIAYQQGFPTFLTASKFKGCKKFCWVNTDIEKAGYSKSFCYKFYSAFDGIVAASDAVKEQLSESFLKGLGYKLHAIYDILNPDLIRQMSNERITYEKGNHLIITTVGRMVPPKGYDIAVNAAKILKDNGLDFQWFFVGNGSSYTQIKNMISEMGLSDNIVLVGENPNPYPYMAMADIYVQPSRFEGFGLTVSEAKILNKPIISTDFPSVFNQIRPGVDRIVCKMSAESIASEITRLATDQAIRQSIIAETTKEQNTKHLTEIKKVEKLLNS